MTTQLEQDVALAEGLGFRHVGKVCIGYEEEIHALCNAIREQAVPDGWKEIWEDAYNSMLASVQRAFPDEINRQCAHEAMRKMRDLRDCLSATPTREDG